MFQHLRAMLMFLPMPRLLCLTWFAALLGKARLRRQREALSRGLPRLALNGERLGCKVQPILTSVLSCS